MDQSLKLEKRKFRKRRVRARITGIAKIPRLSVFRSNQHMFLQLIDDTKGHTIVSASTQEVREQGTKTERAAEAARLLAERAHKAGISRAVFDRGGYKYHGRVKAAAEAARDAGLTI